MLGELFIHLSQLTHESPGLVLSLRLYSLCITWLLMPLSTLPSDPVWMMNHTVALPTFLYPGRNWLAPSSSSFPGALPEVGQATFPLDQGSANHSAELGMSFTFLKDGKNKDSRTWIISILQSPPDLLQNKFADPYFLLSGVKGGQIPVDQYPTTVPSGTEVGRQIITSYLV